MMSIKKNLIRIFLLAVIFLISENTFATKRYWVGNGSNLNWNATANWSGTSGGATGASVPVAADSVYFDGNGIGQCSINATVSIKRLEILSAYTDTVKQNTYAITIGTSGAVLSGGTFFGGSAAITDQGIFTLSGTYFQSTSGVFTIQGNYSFTSGTFLNNNGNVTFNGNISITGSTTFYDLRFTASATTLTFTINASTVLTSTHLLTHTGVQTVILNTGTIEVTGDITASNTHTSGGGTATININGTGNQYLNGSATNPGQNGWLCNVTINKPSGTLFLKDMIAVKGYWTYTAGTIDATTYNSTVSFNNVSRVFGSHSLNHIWVYAYGAVAASLTVNTGTTLTVLGDIVTAGSGLVVFEGNISLKGSYITSSTYSGNGGTGNGVITFDGTGNQIIVGNATVGMSRLPNVVINKPSGTFTLKDIVSVFGDFIVSSGSTIDTVTGSTLAFFSSSRSITGKFRVNNLTFNATTTSTNNITSGDTVTVEGMLKTDGPFQVTMNGGVISAKGDIWLNNSHNVSGGTGTILINGTGDQDLTGSTTLFDGALCNVKINKPSGTLILKNIVSLGNNSSWQLINGALDATTFNSTVAFIYGTRTISGNQTFNKLIFNSTGVAGINNITTNDTITVNDELRIEGNFPTSFNTGSIKAKGDILVTNTSSGVTTSSGLIKICGTGDQTFTGCGIVPSGRLCNITIDKPSGVLNLSSIITFIGSWNYIRGNVNSGTSTVVAYLNTAINCEGTTAIMAFHNFSVYGNVGSTANLTGAFTASGKVYIISGSFNGNGKTITIGGDWQNAGVLVGSISNFCFNGTTSQYIIKSSTESFYNLSVNKPSGKLYSVPSLNITNKLSLIKGVVSALGTGTLNLFDNDTISGGSDSSYVAGPLKKTGNDAFTFPLGDTLLSSGAYHPLVITAPSVATDAYTAQYFAQNQTSGSTLQTDSLSSISNCESWLLTRNTGSSVVVPTLGWNTNSCNVACHKLRVSGWDGSQWKSLGYDGVVTSGNTGIVKAHSGLNLASLPLVIAHPLSSSLAPTITALSDTTMCAGGSATLTASGGSTYVWTPSTGLSSTTGDTVTASPATTTTYTVTGTNSNGCSNTASVTVTINPSPTVTATSSSAICIGESRVLTAYGASAYTWSPSTGLDTAAGAVVTASPTSNVTYIVTGTDTLGCSDTSMVTITVHPIPVVIITPSDTIILACDGGTTLVASGASTYLWTSSEEIADSTNYTIDVDPSVLTTYKVIGTSVYGCIDSATFSLTVWPNNTFDTHISATGFSTFVGQCLSPGKGVVDCNYTGTACIDSTITLNVGGCSNTTLSYSWDMGTGAVLTGDSISYTYTSAFSGNIILTVIDSVLPDTMVKYIPITVTDCTPLLANNCCEDPEISITNKIIGLDTTVAVTENGIITLCKDLMYTLQSNCYRIPSEGSGAAALYVTWIISDTDPFTADTSYSGGSFVFTLPAGNYTLTMLVYGVECDSNYIHQQLQILDCTPVACEDCIKSFSPIPGKKYVLSAWVKQDGAINTVTNYTTPKITITCPSVSFTSSAFVPSGNIIDGWQKIDGEVTIPISASDINIKLECTSGDCYFDDIRIFPFDGSMKSYVYDPVTMRLVSELDERNYATLYEYDEEGKLVRVKKETEKGIMTIKENRNSSRK